MDHFGPSHRVKKRTLRFLSTEGRKTSILGKIDLKNTRFGRFLSEIVNISCFLSFYLICAPKRATFLLWNGYTLKFMTPHSKALFSKWPPMLEKIWPPIKILTPTLVKISCPRMDGKLYKIIAFLNGSFQHIIKWTIFLIALSDFFWIRPS